MVSEGPPLKWPFQRQNLKENMQFAEVTAALVYESLISIPQYWRPSAKSALRTASSAPLTARPVWTSPETPVNYVNSWSTDDTLKLRNEFVTKTKTWNNGPDSIVSGFAIRRISFSVLINGFVYHKLIRLLFSWIETRAAIVWSGNGCCDKHYSDFYE